MPESKRNTHGQNGAPKSYMDDYLPDYSPRPKYVIATIYPPSSEPIAIPGRERGDERGGPPVPVRPSRKTSSLTEDTGLPAILINGAIDTGWNESSLGISSDGIARAGSGSADTLLGSPGSLGIVSPRSESSIPVTEPPARGNFPLMELPRGKFRSLERNASLISLLHELHVHAFRGSCRINRDGSSILLVFDGGKIILAKYNELAGDAALDMVCIHRFARVDAIISDLDDAQIRLSLEFNQSWKVEGEQEPSCIVAPEGKLHDVRKLSLPYDAAPESEPDPGDAGNMVLPANTGVVSSAREPAGNRAEEKGTPDMSRDNRITEDSHIPPSVRDEPGMPVPDEPEVRIDRRSVLSSSPPVPDFPPDSESLPMVENEAVWKKALTIPVIPPERHRIVHEPEDWKRAISMPVAATDLSAAIRLKNEQWKNIRELPATGLPPAWIPEFELINTDSGLFDDVPVRKKMPGASGPEPAEQWKSMGINRGENSSV